MPEREAPIIYEPVLDSTNLLLKALAERGAREGTVAIASRQTAGRGRLGRSFQSPEGGLYLSILLRPDCTLERAAGLSILAAVAVCRAVREATGLQPGIKWPNDVIVDSRKLCGILVESAAEGSGCRVIIGIGINANTAPEDFGEDIRSTVCSILGETGKRTDTRELARRLIRQLDGLYEQWKSGSSVLDEFRGLCLNLGREVLVRRGEGRKALALNVNDDGSLRVRYEDGSEEDIRYGEVSVRGLLGYT